MSAPAAEPSPLLPVDPAPIDPASPRVTEAGRRIAAGTLAGWAQALISITVSLLQVRLVFQFLPRELSGVWFLFLTLAGYVALFDLGISPTLSREISFALGSGASEAEVRQRVANLVGTGRRAFAVIGLFVLALSLGAGLWFLSSLAPARSVREVQTAWVVFVLGATLSVYGNAALATMTGLGAVAGERLVRAASQIVFLALTYVALRQGAGLRGLAGAWLAQAILLTLAGSIGLRRMAPWLGRASASSRGLLWSVMAPSLKWATTAFGSVLILETDNVIIAKTMGPAAIPPYEVVAKLAFVTLFLSAIAVTSSVPFLSQAYAGGDLAQVRSMTLRNVRLGMGVMVVMAAWVLVYAEPFIDLWVGPGNFVGEAVVAVFVVMLILEAHHRFLATTSMAMGDLVFHWLALGAGVLNIALTLVLVRYLGLLGIVLGSMLAQLTTNNWYVPRYTLRSLRIPVIGYLRTIALPILAVFAVAAAVGGLVRGSLAEAPPLLQLAAGLVAVGCVGSLAMGGMVLTAEERRTVAGAAGRILSAGRPS